MEVYPAPSHHPTTPVFQKEWRIFVQSLESFSINLFKLPMFRANKFLISFFHDEIFVYVKYYSMVPANFMTKLFDKWNHGVIPWFLRLSNYV